MRCSLKIVLTGVLGYINLPLEIKLFSEDQIIVPNRSAIRFTTG
jgi:hypothetical protein